MTERKSEEELFGDPMMQLILAAARVSETRPKILYPTRFRDVLLAKSTLDELLSESGENVKSFIRIHHAFCSASVCVEVEYLEIRDISKLITAVGRANNFELCYLTNGKLSLALTFQNALIPVE